MSLHDEDIPLTAFVQEEMMDCLAGTLAGVLDRLSPVARIRILAFLHLVEKPESMKATLEVLASGHLRLTLDTSVTPCRSQQH
jgi:hypothetical protein